MFSNIKSIRACRQYWPDTCSHHSALYVAGNHGVWHDSGVRADLDGHQNFRTGANIDVAGNVRKAAGVSYPDRNLLEDQAVDANFGCWMNDYPVGVRNQQATTDLTVERDICARNDAPKRMPHDKYLAEGPTDYSPTLMPGLVATNRPQ